jgi:hypothetical protein
MIRESMVIVMARQPASPGRFKSNTATWGKHPIQGRIRVREEELGPCGELAGLFTSCITKWQDVQGTWCSSALHTKHIKIRQRFHHVISIDYRPRMVRFGHDHECNPSGVLTHRRIRRGKHTLRRSHPPCGDPRPVYISLATWFEA